MLEVGNGSMTKDEYIAHFGLWALMTAPLLIGCHITNMSVDTKEVLSNKEVCEPRQIGCARQESELDGAIQAAGAVGRPTFEKVDCRLSMESSP
ncbi:hypothetical protein L7F22_031054 [Adiantum nelumboides]|nr:hypothetical protein [Adiantum nelumboides]